MPSSEHGSPPSFSSPSKDYYRLKGKNAEELVYDLAKNTFFVDWCFPNPKLPAGKEVCDLLVVYDTVAIIWQIKDLKLDSRGQYNKSEVEKNLRQLSGARRQLFDLRTPIELENVRRRKEKFDPTVIKDIYLISALLGEGEGEDTFSLVEEIANHRVHVFNRSFVEIILNELDTVGDFTHYLKAKEHFVSTCCQMVIAGGEEDLLAYYLMSGRSFSKLLQVDCVLVDDTFWDDLQMRPEYQAKKKADAISYGWDGIIDRAHEGPEEYERVARELARPNRLERRILSKAFLGAYRKAQNARGRNLFRRVVISDGVTYCFLFRDATVDRSHRKHQLLALCWVARGQAGQNRKVIGVATEWVLAPTASYDFCFLEVPTWTEECQRTMERLQSEAGILRNPSITRVHEDEYPGG